MKRSDMSMTLKATLAKKNLEMEKLEKSKKAHLRMLTSSGVKLKMKQNTADEIVKPSGDVEAKNIKMYETHVPGFCYLRNGERRKRLTSIVSSSPPDPIQCSEKVKCILFTDNELDIYKTMCLHLLGTHVQNRMHIQRKDGRLCSYIKAQSAGNTPHTLQPFSQRFGTSVNKSSSKYDKMLPRYILDVKSLGNGLSNSVKMYDFESSSDEETKKKRKLQVPVYINNEIRMIVHSVMEALENVNSSKFICLINLASSPEELRNMLKNEELQDFIMELSTNPLVMKPTSYDYVMTHLMFDKIPEKGTLESVAQVLEIYDNKDLQKSIYQIQRAILQRHNQLANSNNYMRGKMGSQDKSSLDATKLSIPSATNSRKTSANALNKKDLKETQPTEKDEKNKLISENINATKVEKPDNLVASDKPNNQNKQSTKNVSINLDKILTDSSYTKDISTYETYDENPLLDEGKGSFTQSRSSSIDSNKYSFQNLTNPQRILFGLKVASLKSKTINMHQLEGKKKLDLAAILAPIIHQQDSEISSKCSMQSHTSSITQNRKVKKSLSNISDLHTNDLENLTRALLANLRLEISETENKRRVSQFMSSI
ncbi:hypothetical protein RUM44_009274 [Polyplax serrata]|uniref:Uncharacterized protein n=1 Tax=Polyplax serrata TaxID=468196 RepID=A0ABR1AS78_POLSC